MVQVQVSVVVERLATLLVGRVVRGSQAAGQESEVVQINVAVPTELVPEVRALLARRRST
ncbi:MAG: hypothetical protein V2A79_15170 [Planctomycetota bacterium]